MRVYCDTIVPTAAVGGFGVRAVLSAAPDCLATNAERVRAGRRAREKERRIETGRERRRGRLGGAGGRGTMLGSKLVRCSRSRDRDWGRLRLQGGGGWGGANERAGDGDGAMRSRPAAYTTTYIPRVHIIIKKNPYINVYIEHTVYEV